VSAPQISMLTILKHAQQMVDSGDNARLMEARRRNETEFIQDTFKKAKADLIEIELASANEGEAS